jgi:hypothetical protein
MPYSERNSLQGSLNNSIDNQTIEIPSNSSNFKRESLVSSSDISHKASISQNHKMNPSSKSQRNSNITLPIISENSASIPNLKKHLRVSSMGSLASLPTKDHSLRGSTSQISRDPSTSNISHIVKAENNSYFNHYPVYSMAEVPNKKLSGISFDKMAKRKDFVKAANGPSGGDYQPNFNSVRKSMYIGREILNKFNYHL